MPNVERNILAETFTSDFTRVQFISIRPNGREDRGRWFSIERYQEMHDEMDSYNEQLGSQGWVFKLRFDTKPYDPERAALGFMDD